jgi:hypothetical protein
MWLAAILLVFSVPQNGNTVAEKNTSATGVSAEDSSLSHSLPSAPELKSGEVAATGDSIAGMNGGAVAPPETLNLTPAVEPRYSPSAGMAISPAKAFIGRPYETPAQRKLWYALSITGSGLAAADAWSTRRAITQGYGVEGNPMLRPFSHSSVLYGATQVSPLVMDFIGKRLMVSQHRLLRKAWWVPQLAGSGMSTFAVVHNVRLVP